MAKLLSAKVFCKKILDWFDKYGRKNLPWQQDITPYRVWVSEIMLQQTQVKTVIPYFLSFMDHFPSIAELANATEDKVLHQWTGLGYYARARNLHNAAKVIMADFKGAFPDNFDDLISLPGIGRSTAGAICAIAYQQKQAILDGNVKRVLARFAAIEGWPGKTTVLEKLWELAENYTPKNNVAKYTQAMMDLGATVCTRTKPKCEECPLKLTCTAQLMQQQAKYPGRKAKKPLPVRKTIMLLVKNNQHEFLLEKRPSHGLWGGLWIFPQCSSTKGIASWCLNNDIHISKQSALAPFRHTFSHYHLDIEPILIHTEVKITKVMEPSRFIWYNHSQSIGLAAPVKKLLQEIL